MKRERDRDGGVLGYVSEHFQSARKAMKFLRTIPIALQDRLKLSELEQEFGVFANTHLNL